MDIKLRRKMLSALDKEELIDIVIELQDSKEIRYIPYPNEFQILIQIQFQILIKF